MAINNAQDPTPAVPSKYSSRSRKRRWLFVLLWSTGVLLALLLLVAGAIGLWLSAAAKASLPVLDGETHLAGLSAPVTVRLDVRRRRTTSLWPRAT
jgi:hypothetical protein